MFFLRASRRRTRLTSAPRRPYHPCHFSPSAKDTCAPAGNIEAPGHLAGGEVFRVSGREVDEYEFSEQDQFSPRYCKRCHRHTPAAVLAANDGVCNACRAEREREQAREAERQKLAAEEARANAEEAESLKAAERTRVYETATGYGVCPACGSPNVEMFTSGGADGAAQGAFACCSCMFIAWPLAFLAPFLFRRPITYHYRCNSCGHGWQG